MRLFNLVLPAGIEPALRAPEARVLSIKLREQMSGPLEVVQTKETEISLNKSSLL